MRYLKHFNKKTFDISLVSNYIAAMDNTAGIIGLISTVRDKANRFILQQLKEHGIRLAEYQPDGTLKCTSRKARNEVLKSRNLHDRDAGYGDWAGE